MFAPPTSPTSTRSTRVDVDVNRLELREYLVSVHMDTQTWWQVSVHGPGHPTWLLAKWADAQPDAPLLIWEPKEGEGARWTYGGSDPACRRLAAGLAARGITKGDKVVIHCDNSPEMVLAWYACAVVGALGVTTNRRTVAAEMSYFVQQTKRGCCHHSGRSSPGDGRSGGSRVAVIVVTEDNSGAPATAEQAAHDTSVSMSFTVTKRIVLAHRIDGARRHHCSPRARPRPKAVVHTHANALWAARVGPTNISVTPGRGVPGVPAVLYVDAPELVDMDHGARHPAARLCCSRSSRRAASGRSLQT